LQLYIHLYQQLLNKWKNSCDVNLHVSHMLTLHQISGQAELWQVCRPLLFTSFNTKWKLRVFVLATHSFFD